MVHNGKSLTINRRNPDTLKLPLGLGRDLPPSRAQRPSILHSGPGRQLGGAGMRGRGHLWAVLHTAECGGLASVVRSVSSAGAVGWGQIWG